MDKMLSLDNILAPIPMATRVMMETAKQDEKFAPPSIQHGLSTLGIGPMDYETMKANDHWPLNPNFKSYEHTPFEDPMAPTASPEEVLDNTLRLYNSNAGAAGMEGYKPITAGGFSSPVSADRSSGVGLGDKTEEAQTLDPTAPPSTPEDNTGSGEQDQGSSDEIQQMFLALDDGTLQGAERMVKSFNQIFDEYARRTGRNMQTDLFTLQPGRQRETEYTTLNPGAY